MFFLIVYDRHKGKIISNEKYRDEDRETAEKDRLALEIKFNEDKISHEVALLEAVDEKQLSETTHRRYFYDPKTIITASGTATITKVK